VPRVSVLSSTYNHEKYVLQAVRSILNQTFDDFELIMCDDASTDANAEKIRSINDPRLTLLMNDENCGNTAASRRCWEISSGEYLAWLLTDDVCEPHMLETLVQFLDKNPSVDAVFGLANFIDEDGNFTGQTWTNGGVGLDRYQLLHSCFYPQGYFCAPAAMVRRSLFEKVGYYPPHMMQLNDMEHYVRMLFQGNVQVIDEKVVNYRIRANAGNASAAKPDVSYRLAFEAYQLLSIFSEQITSFDLLAKIFPEVAVKGWQKDDRLTQFYLAQLATDFGPPSWSLFGLDLIYRLLADQEMATYIKQNCNFNYPDFFRLVAQKRPIDTELPIRYADAINELNTLRLELFKSLSLKPNPLPGSENIIFGQAIKLKAMWAWRIKLGIHYIAEWCVDEYPERATQIGVHILDPIGNILSQADHKLIEWADGQTSWLDCFVIRNDQLMGACGLGIALFDDPSQTLSINGGECDWGDHRLLLPLEATDGELPAL
jgi:GT2 family glycosyltransferase